VLSLEFNYIVASKKIFGEKTTRIFLLSCDFSGKDKVVWRYVPFNFGVLGIYFLFRPPILQIIVYFR
jgi:hypothetical protein